MFIVVFVICWMKFVSVLVKLCGLNRNVIIYVGCWIGFD